MTADIQTTQFEVLDRVRCLQLLSEHTLGRLGVVIGDQPLIFPVNYTLDGDAIVFRTDPGNKLRGAIGSRVAFEVDCGDTKGHAAGGWSALVIGRAELVDIPREAARLTQLEVGPWNPGPREFWVRIRTGAVTGRRIVPS
jgi:uncharacterized protein